MKLVYIAGPFRAPTAWGIEQNIRAAETAGLELMRRAHANGTPCAAVIPHTMYRHFQGALPDDAWLKADLAILERCGLCAVPTFVDRVGRRPSRAFILPAQIDPCIL